MMKTISRIYFKISSKNKLYRSFSFQLVTKEAKNNFMRTLKCYLQLVYINFNFINAS